MSRQHGFIPAPLPGPHAAIRRRHGGGPWAFLALVVASVAVAPAALAELEELPTRLPTMIPADSVFSPLPRRPERLARVESSDASYVPYPEQIRSLPMVPRVYLDDQGRVITQPVPADLRPRILQGFLYRNTSVTALSAGNLNYTSILLETSLASPWLVAGAPPVATPFFTAHILQGPYAPDMPPQLYDLGLEVRWLKQLRPRLGVDLAVAPAAFTDFNTSQATAFRVVGRGMLLWDITPRLQSALGAAYLGRLDIPALPIAGAIWSPNEDWRIEAVFPRPRAARRFIPPPAIDRLAASRVGPLLGFSPDQDHWAYLVAELGGNTYAIRRASGANDRVTYSELRLALGWERRIERGVSSRNEIGYAFHRSLDYLSAPGRQFLADGLMLRSDVAF